MESQVMDRPVARPDAATATGAERPGRKAVVLSHQDVLVCLDIKRVVGCVQVEKLARLPGSHDRIAGILLFRGRPIPLVSVRPDSSVRRPHLHAKEEHALVVSTRGREFAIRVDGVPKIVDAPLPYRTYADVPCVMRTRHLDRFFALCVLSDDKPTDWSGAPDCRRAG